MLRGLLNGAETSLVERAIAACERGTYILTFGKAGCLQARSYREFAFDAVHTKRLRDPVLVAKWNRFEPQYQATCSTKTSKTWQRRFVVPVMTDGVNNG